MKIVQTSILAANLGASMKTAAFDMTKLIGIAVAKGVVYLMSYDVSAKVTEKMTAQIPSWKLPADAQAITYVKSVQVAGGILVAETVGPLTVGVRDVIQAISTRLMTDKMVSGFFPATAGEAMQSQYYYGADPNNLKNVTEKGAQNIRLMGYSPNLLFNLQDTKEMQMLALSDMNKSWVPAAKTVATFDKNIAFLGRVQAQKIDVVLNDETTVYAKLDGAQTRIKQSYLLKQATAVFGLIQHGTAMFLSAIQGNYLVLTPVTAEQQ